MNRQEAPQDQDDQDTKQQAFKGFSSFPSLHRELQEILEKRNLSLAGYFDCQPEEMETVVRRASYYTQAHAWPSTLQELLEMMALQAAMRGEPISVRALKQDVTREELLRVCEKGTLPDLLATFSEEEYQVLAEEFRAIEWNEVDPNDRDTEPIDDMRRELIEKVKNFVAEHTALIQPLYTFIEAAEHLNEPKGVGATKPASKRYLGGRCAKAIRRAIRCMHAP